MCEPATIAAISAAVVSAIVGATTSIVSANNTKKTKEYQAKVAQNNAKIAEENARMESQSGLEEARRQRIKTIQTIGSQQTAMAANGIDISSGSALDTVTDTAEMGELDALMIQYNSDRQAYNYEVTANNYTNQANLDMFAAKNAPTTGVLNAVGSVADSVSSVGMNLDTQAISDKWNSWKTNKSTKVSG